MIDLTGTTAANVKFSDYHRAVYLAVVRADSPIDGEQPRYYASRDFSLSGNDYEDLMAGLSFQWTEVKLKGGLAAVAGCALRLRNEGKAAQLIDDYFLENDPVELYMVFVDGGETDADRIPVGRGVITGYPYGVEEWSLDIIDGSDRDWVEIPRRLIAPVAGGVFENAPQRNWGQPLPLPFGALEQGPYDGNGTRRFLAPCRCVDTFAQKYTSGLYNKSFGTPYQWYNQASRLSEIVDYTQTGAYFTIDSPVRKMILRPVRPETTNTIANWSPAADGDVGTSLSIGAGDALDLFFAGSPKLGTLTQATIEIGAVGDFSYTVKLGTTTLTSGSGSGDTSVSLASHLANWSEDWDFQTLLILCSSVAGATVSGIELDLRFDDHTMVEGEGLTVYQKAQGFADEIAYYADGSTITGIAGTLLTNPVDQLQALLRGKDLLALPVAEIDLASFSAAAAKRSAWNFAFPMFSAIKDIGWLDPFLQEAGLHLYKSAAGQWRVVARDRDAAPQHLLCDEWNIAVRNPDAAYPEWRPEINIDRVENRDLVSDFVVKAQRDDTNGDYNVLEIASSAYRLEGTGTTSSATGKLTSTGATFQADGVEVGWIVYLDADQAYRIDEVTGEEELALLSLVGGAVSDNPVGTKFWLGPNLDERALRARRRYKTLEPLGAPRQGVVDAGGYESGFVADQATARLFVDHWIQWHAQLPLKASLETLPGHLDVEPGDIAFFDHPWLPDKKRPTTLTTLDGAITAVATILKVTDDEVELIREGDWLLLRDDPRQPEVVLVDSIDPGTDQVTVQRGQANTQAAAHADSAAVERVTAKWEVLGVRPPEPNNMRIGLRLMEMPDSYFPVVTIAPDSTPDWPAMSDVEKERYRAIAHNSGLIEDRVPDTGAYIGA